MRDIKMSIVTVCLDAAGTVEQAMDSVLSQTCPPFEYIVIDGGSTDGTREIIERYRPRLTHLVLEPDEGIYDAFNKGVARATGDVVGILNADDLYAPWALETVAEAYRQSPDPGVFYGKLAVVDEARCRWTVYPVGDHHRLTGRMSIAHPATFVARSVYDRHGLFDPSFRVSGDWDLMLRFFRWGVPFCPIDKVLTAFRNSGVSSAYSERLFMENRRIHKDALPPLAAFKATLKMYLKRWGRRWIDDLGLSECYARYRDSRLLCAEVSGAFDGSFGRLWEALSHRRPSMPSTASASKKEPKDGRRRGNEVL